MTPSYRQEFWQKRLELCQQALVKNKFAAYIAHDPAQAQEIVFKTILPTLDNIKLVSWGDSQTLRATGVLEQIERNQELTLIKTFEQGVPREVILERRRQALLVDLFFTGSNAITEDGKLVNLDMVGNRVAGLTFGPRHVILCVGRNKIVPDVDQAMERIKRFAAPLNAARHEGFSTPCVQTSYCLDCNSPDRICNVWSITEKSFPKKRIHVILINQDLGL